MHHNISTVDFNTCPICGKVGMTLHSEPFLTNVKGEELFLLNAICQCRFCQAEKIWRSEPLSTLTELENAKTFVARALIFGEQFYLRQLHIDFPPPPNTPRFFQGCPECDSDKVEVSNDSGDFLDFDDDDVQITVECKNCGTFYQLYYDIVNDTIEEMIVDYARKAMARDLADYYREYEKWESEQKGKTNE